MIVTTPSNNERHDQQRAADLERQRASAAAGDKVLPTNKLMPNGYPGSESTPKK
jgi:hypothetical protein